MKKCTHRSLEGIARGRIGPQLVSHRGKQHVSVDEVVGAHIVEDEAARAVCGLGIPRLHALLAQQSRLLVTQASRYRDVFARPTENFPIDLIKDTKIIFSL